MKRETVEAELQEYGGKILRRPEFLMAFSQKHHHVTTVGDHSLRVAKASIRICGALSKLRIPIRKEDVVVGALCHDLGILGRHVKYKNNTVCRKMHPKDSVDVAKRILPELNENTEGIIRDHMWPFGGRRPKSREGLIVSLADKYAAVRDAVEGRLPGKRQEAPKSPEARHFH